MSNFGRDLGIWRGFLKGKKLIEHNNHFCKRAGDHPLNINSKN